MAELSASKKGESDADGHGKNGLIEVSTRAIALALIPLAIISSITWWMGLAEVSTSLLAGCIRTLMQLSVLGTLLKPIFLWSRPWLVLGYALFMIVMASYEASSRTKYMFDGQFYCILTSIVVNVGWVGLLAFCVILRPVPVWNPRYLIPIVGMLLGNSISGISLSLDAITKAMVEEQQEIELYLSFGASKWEAISRLFGEAIRTGATPILNTMSVIGIISIPGMMTGQILGGSPAMTAARYQMLIIYLIAMSTLSVVLMNSYLAVEVGFDAQHHNLRMERFMKNDRLRVAGMIMWLLSSTGSYISTGVRSIVTPGKLDPSTGMTASSILNSSMVTEDDASSAPSGTLALQTLRESCFASDDDNTKLEVAGLSRYLPTSAISRKDGVIEHTRRVLFEDVSLTVGVGDLLLVSGPSGVGKSTLLRMMAGLSPLHECLDDRKDSTTRSGPMLRLGGKTWGDRDDGWGKSLAWRKQVRYVTQSKVNIPGTPLDLMERIASFKSWRDNGPSLQDWIQSTGEYVVRWGLKKDSLTKEWYVLSGGEAQRVLVALALASKPSILLFDESTSALDRDTKIAVENSVKDYIHAHTGGACWISHDTEQAERMASFESDSTSEEGSCSNA